MGKIRKIPLHGFVKSFEDNQIRIKRLNKLDEEMVTSTLEDIRNGLVNRDTLRLLCQSVGFKIKDNPEIFKTAGDTYVSEALINFGNGIEISKAFGFTKGAKNKNVKIHDLKIAYAIWLEIKTQETKPLSAFYKIAAAHNISPDKARIIYYKHKNEIDHKYSLIEKTISE
jgi:hypothetical protein